MKSFFNLEAFRKKNRKGFTIVELVIVIAVITFIISMLGVRIGSVFGDRYKIGSEIMGGIILILIGLRTLIVYLLGRGG